MRPSLEKAQLALCRSCINYVPPGVDPEGRNCPTLDVILRDPEEKPAIEGVFRVVEGVDDGGAVGEYPVCEVRLSRAEARDRLATFAALGIGDDE